MDDKVFVSSIRMMGKERSNVIPAGEHFLKEEMVADTFDKCVVAGYIKEVDMNTRQLSVVNQGKGRPTGPANETPAAALNPPVKGAEQRNTPEEVGEMVDIRTKLKTLGVWAPHNCKLSTLKEKLKEAERKKLNAPQVVWDDDPEKLEVFEFARLMAHYKETCTQYDIKVEVFTDKALLIKKMSSEFKG